MNVKQHNLLMNVITISILPILVIVLALFLIVNQNEQKNNLTRKIDNENQISQKLEKTQQTAQILYSKKMNNTVKKFNNKMMSSDNTKLSSIYQSTNHNLQAENAINHFFNLYATWNNGTQTVKQWEKIKKQNLVSDNIAQNKSIFYDLNDDSGSNKLNSLGLQSAYIGSKLYVNPTNNETADGYIVVKTASHYKNRWYGETNNLYHVVYNYKQKQITTLDLVTKMNSKSLPGTQYDTPKEVIAENKD